ncbi:MAG: flavin reductase family protein [Armatimonadetes bacterium]|mgnify:FL=1|nr:flavin reductase family protein [Armatimonadota bacterium]
MSEESVSIDFGAISHDLAYSILVATIHPRPIAFVSTISGEGALNLAPFSFFMVGGSNPPSLVFSPTLSRMGAKDSLRNVQETGDFVVNLVHREMADSMNLTSKGYPADVSEWEIAGLTPAPSVKVKAPRVAESLVQFECKLYQVIEHGHGPGSARYVIGEVLYAHLHPTLWDGEKVVDELVRPIARMGGPHYLDTNALEFFSLERPK